MDVNNDSAEMEDTVEIKDSSSDDDNDDEEELKLEARAAELERELDGNKYLYNVHVELVGLYKDLSDLKSMRAAYQRFAEVFPLTPAIWLAWLRDEVKLANSQTEKKHILTLFDKAVQDYLSIDLWLEYVQFALGFCELEETREILEKGVRAIGLHVSQGSLLWDTYREIELAHLSLHEDLSEMWHQQATKVFEIFKRQLSIPLLNMKNTYGEWQLWLSSLPEGHNIKGESLEWNYKQALKLLQLYEPHENAILEAKDDELRLAYKNYIKDVTDPATILCLYERAVAQMSLNSRLWQDYCLYAISLGEISVDISKRALRNCTWDECLWVTRMRVLEVNQKEEKLVTECFEQALQSITPNLGLDIWLAYVEYIRRVDTSEERLRKLFVQASQQLGTEGDPTCKFLRWEARFCARKGDMKDARKVWNKILHTPTYAGKASAWLELCNLERQYGEEGKVRTTFKHALSACTDWPLCIAEEWIMFERELGTVENMLECIKISEQILAQFEETQAANLNEANNHTNDNDDKRKNRKRALKNDKNDVESKKTKKEDLPYQIVSHHSLIDPEKSVFLSNMRGDIDENFIFDLFPNAKIICRPSDRKGTSRCYAYVQFSTAEEVEEALKRDREPIDGRPLFVSRYKTERTEKKTFNYSTNIEKNKLFIRGLPYTYSDKDVEAIFASYEPKSVRLVLQRSGKSKGLAYVEFEKEENAKRALQATDQINLEGHTISVAISAPPPKADKPSSQPFHRRHDSQGPSNVPRPRLKTSLVPNTVLQKKPEGKTIAKTNEDFRKMVMKMD